VWIWLLLLRLAGAAHADIVFDPPRWDLDPPLLVGQGASRLVTVSNTGSQPVTVRRVTPGPGLQAALAGDHLEPGAQLRLTAMVLAPAQPGSLDSKITLGLDDGTNLDFAVAGQIVAAAPGSPLLPAEVVGGHYQPRPGDQPVTARVFYNRTCGSCAAFVKHIVEPVAAYFGPAVTIHVEDLNQPAAFAAAGQLKAAYHLDREANTYLFVGAHALAGEDIDRNLYPLLLAELQQPSARPQAPGAPPAAPAPRPRAGLPVLLVYGLGDGCNPCAFATAVFLIALLTRVGGGRRRLLAAGGAFTAAVFVTYSLLGLGVLGALGWFEGKERAAEVLRYGVAAVALGCAAGQARDVVCLRRGAPTRDLALSLPPGLLRGIHAVLRAVIRPDHSVLRLALGTAAAGCAVTLLQAPCTSQVYLTVLVALKSSPWRADLVLAVLGYNLGFVLPLLAVLALTARGLAAERLAHFARRHLALAKTALALLLTSLALWLLLAGGHHA
jgi:cytochrome c biogenesis protein CcdA